MNEDQIGNYFEDELRRSGLTPVCGASANVIHKVSQAILGCLRRLDRLPRAHAVWDGTNGRPTIGKLSRFCDMKLREDPADRESLWALAALALWHCESHFGLPQWKALRGLGEIDNEEAIHSAMHVQLSSGVSTISELVAFIKESENEEQAISTFKDIECSDSERCSKWASSALRHLDADVP